MKFSKQSDIQVILKLHLRVDANLSLTKKVSPAINEANYEIKTNEFHYSEVENIAAR